MKTILNRLRETPTPAWVGVVIALVFALILLGGCRCPRACGAEELPARPLVKRGEIAADGPTRNGETITAHLPASKHLKNKGGSDGAGLCVFASLSHQAAFMNLRDIEGVFEYMTKFPGGGHPQKVDEVLARYCREKGIKVPDYIQHTGGNMDFLKLALKTGRYPAVTYAGADGVFYQQGIYHMVNLVHLSDKYAVIHDNNNPGKYLWMLPSDFEQRWKAKNGGWAVVFLNSPPAPVPSSPKVEAGPEVKPIAGIKEFDETPEQCKGPNCNGLTWEKIPEVEGYSFTGRSISKEEALTLVGGDQLADDSSKKTLTAYGDSEFLAAFDRLLNSSEMASWKDKLHIQKYKAGDWDATNIGLAEGISLQGAPKEGKAPVLWRFRTMPTVGQLVEAIREKDPNYKPANDPDPLNKPAPAPAPAPAPNSTPTTPTKIPLAALGFLGLLGFAAWRFRDRILPNANRS